MRPTAQKTAACAMDASVKRSFSEANVPSATNSSTNFSYNVFHAESLSQSLDHAVGLRKSHHTDEWRGDSRQDSDAVSDFEIHHNNWLLFYCREWRLSHCCVTRCGWLSCAMRMPFRSEIHFVLIEYLQLVVIWDDCDDGPDCNVICPRTHFPRTGSPTLKRAMGQTYSLTVVVTPALCN